MGIDITKLRDSAHSGCVFIDKDVLPVLDELESTRDELGNIFAIVSAFYPAKTAGLTAEWLVRELVAQWIELRSRDLGPALEAATVELERLRRLETACVTWWVHRELSGRTDSERVLREARDELILEAAKRAAKGSQ